jgi:CheY-like chemotaxis protein
MSSRFVRALPNLPERPGRVLVCEDSDELRALLVSRLAKERRLEIVGDVASSEAALEAALRLRPDALLLDLMLDDTDPKELLLALARMDPRPLVIVFSGMAPTALTPEVRGMIDLHLDKPTPLHEVADLVTQTIASHRTGERL